MLGGDCGEPRVLERGCQEQEGMKQGVSCLCPGVTVMGGKVRAPGGRLGSLDVHAAPGGPGGGRGKLSSLTFLYSPKLTNTRGQGLGFVV